MEWKKPFIDASRFNIHVYMLFVALNVPITHAHDSLGVEFGLTPQGSLRALGVSHSGMRVDTFEFHVLGL